jgi:hypothetical protein
MSTLTKTLIGIGVGIVATAAIIGTTAAIVHHIEKKKYEPCERCQKMKELKQQDLFSADDKKAEDRLNARHADLIKEYGSCDCAHKEASLAKVKGAFDIAQDELKGWINIEKSHKELEAEVNVMQQSYAKLQNKLDQIDRDLVPYE